MKAAAAFDTIEWRHSTWSVVLDAEQTVGLYASYSNVSLRHDREAVLAELSRIARNEFNNQVTRHVTTVLYMARRSEFGWRFIVHITRFHNLRPLSGSSVNAANSRDGGRNSSSTRGGTSPFGAKQKTPLGPRRSLAT
jgi:hypothetical protein